MERNRCEIAIRCLEMALHPNTGDDEVIAAVNGFRRTAAGTPLRAICAAFATADGPAVSAEAARWRSRLDRLRQENLALRGRIKAEEDRAHADAMRLQNTERELALALGRAEEAERAFAQFRAAYGERRGASRPDAIPTPRGLSNATPGPSFQSILAAARQRTPWTA